MPHQLTVSPVLLVGTGAMAAEYAKVLRALEQPFTVAGRSEATATAFALTWGVPAGSGPLERQLEALPHLPQMAIVAAPAASLAEASTILAQRGVTRLLIEKPAALEPKRVQALANDLQKAGVEAYVAYNRRFYASVEKARALIHDDGGVLSLKFDFTEARTRIEALNKPKEDLEGWFYGNSTHVLDTAFYLAGLPETIHAQRCGQLDWHPSGAIFTGQGRTAAGALFSYHANWLSPGRWGVEIMTPARRLILQPMEQLFQQLNGSFACQEVAVENELDLAYKPGIYTQTKAFVSGKRDERLLDVQEHARLFSLYATIRDGGTLAPTSPCQYAPR